MLHHTFQGIGQKMPMTEEFLHTEPAQTDHRWAEHNEWDIGTSFASPYIWLFASATGTHHGIRHYPMLIPGSRDYGTVNLRASHRGRHFSVKVYPRLVHVIKSFNSHLQGGIPRTLRGVRNQVAAALRMIHSLTGRDGMGLGGFRIEVTVKAPSLQEATRVVRTTRFLDPQYWLCLGEGPHARHPLSAKLAHREAFLDNANWVYEQAVLGKVFQCQAGDRPTKPQLQALTDILNALGWNGGLRTLSEIYQTGDQRALFQLARANSTGDGLPSNNHPNDQHHRYQVNKGRPFRIRCCMDGCYHKLQRAAIVHWIAELVTCSVVEGSKLGLDI
ncbi:hypothetical protein JCM24511_02023 [Saitozyma sp. JCM 24511]|nr:hypothetical protein JCM24511_02023 [Saitozyma sp. JCM 24511]